MVTLTFQLPQPGSGVITYVTRSLTWLAHYLLEIDDEGCGHLRGDATLHNRSALPFEPAVLTLVAGQVQESPSRRPRPLAHRLAADVSFESMTPTWRDHDFGEEQKEIAGLYRYELLHPPHLAGNADVTVPFDEVLLSDTSLTAVLTQQMQFSSLSKGVFLRCYRMVVGRPLLSAKVTIRDQGYLVGEQNVMETAAGEPVSLILGRDPNMNYRREVTRLTGEVLAEAEGTRRRAERKTLDTYRIRYELRNAGIRTVPYEVTEQTAYLKIKNVRGDVQRQSNTIFFQGTLAPAEVKVIEFEVVINATDNDR